MEPEIIAPNKEKIIFCCGYTKPKAETGCYPEASLDLDEQSDSDKYYSNYSAAFPLFDLMTCPSL